MTALVHKMERQNVVSQKTQTYIDPAGNHHSFTIKTVEKWDSKKKVWFIDSVIIGYPEGLLQIPHNFEGTRIAPPNWEFVEETDDYDRQLPLDVVQFVE